MVTPVIHLVISLAPGGLERLVVDWTNARNQLHPGSTRIVCLDEPGALAGQVEGGTVSCVKACRSRFPWDHAAVRRVVDILPQCAPVLHAHNLAAWQYGVLAKVLLARGKNSHPVRLVYSQHGANVHNMRLRDRIRARILACFTDEIVAVSEATAEVMAKTMWVPRKRIRVIVNGVVGKKESASFAKATVAMEVRTKCGIPENACVIGSVGRLAQVKGCDRLIRAFAELNRSQALNQHEVPVVTGVSPVVAPEDAADTAATTEDRNERKHTVVTGVSPVVAPEDAADTAATTEERASGAPVVTGVSPVMAPEDAADTAATTEDRNERKHTVVTGVSPVVFPFLLLTGDGPERANLEHLARELGIADRVIFTGYQADPTPYLAAMDLFVLPSRNEGLSVALLEAMAAGVPVAVTDVGASREVVEGGKCGAILPDDEGAWAGIIATVLKDPVNAEKVKAAQQRVKNRYSLNATLDGYEQLYS